MPNWLHFFIEHWILSSLAIVLFLLIIIEEMRSKMTGVKKVSIQEATQLVNRENAIIVDIRDANAYAQGHIADSVNIAKAELDKDTKKLNKYQGKPVIVVCAQGISSVACANQLKKQGVGPVYSLAGGIQGWKNAGLPVVK